MRYLISFVVLTYVSLMLAMSASGAAATAGKEESTSDVFNPKMVNIVQGGKLFVLSY